MAPLPPTYRFVISNPRSTSPKGLMIDELLGVFGVNMTKFLNKPGSLTLSIRMNNQYRQSHEILVATNPGRSAIWVYRSTGGVDRVVWSGIIWSRTYQSEAEVMTITAQTYDSWFDQCYLDNFAFNYTDSAWNLLLLGMSSAASSTFNSSGSYAPPMEYVLPGLQAAHGPTINVKTEDYSGQSCRSIMDTAIQAGAEYRCQPSGQLFGFTTTGRMNLFEVGMTDSQSFMVGKSSSEITETFDYPGRISKYWWPESYGSSADNATNLFWTARTRDGGLALIFSPSYVGPPDMGRISTARALTIQNAATTGDASNIVAQTATQHAVPATAATFELNAQHTGVDFDAFDVGDYFRYVIKDPYRFPNTRIGLGRIIGWTLTPPSQDAPEQIGITVQDPLSTVIQSGLP